MLQEKVINLVFDRETCLNIKEGKNITKKQAVLYCILLMLLALGYIATHPWMYGGT